MKRLLTFFLIFGFAFTIISCQKKETYSYEVLKEANPRNDIYYQIFVRSFADSDGDGIGDLKGIEENLDYLKDLGITALWLMPINPSPTYHGYDVLDYYEINPDYGTIEDFKSLVKEANKKNIDIILDLVINHTSDQHPWYLEGKGESHYDYYYRLGSSAHETFVGGMVDLDHNNPAVEAEMKEIMRFYVEMGVKGFRLDAAKFFFDKPGQVGNPVFLNVNYIQMLKLYLRSLREDAYLVTEIWDNYPFLIQPYYRGTDSSFNFPLYYDIISKVGKDQNKGTLISNLTNSYEEYRKYNPNFVDAVFISNHDLDRLASLGGFESLERQKLGAEILLTLPGNPFIYYGEEIGMKGYRYEGDNISGYGVVYDEYRRQPFLWGDNKYQTSWLPSDGSNNQTIPLNEQKTDPNSLYNTYQELVELRKKTHALKFGNEIKRYINNSGTIQGFVKTFEYQEFKQTVVVLYNLSSYEQEISHEKVKVLYGSLTMKPYSTLVLEVESESGFAYVYG